MITRTAAYVIKSRGGQAYDSDCHTLDAEGGEGAHLFIVWVEQDREVLISQGPVEQPGAGCGLGFLCLRYTCSLSHTAAKSVVERWEGRCKASWKRGSKLPLRGAGPPHHHDGEVDSDQ